MSDQFTPPENPTVIVKSPYDNIEKHGLNFNTSMKILFAIVVTILISLGIIAVYLFYFKPKNISQQTTPQVKVIQEFDFSTRLSIAKLALNWIDTQKDTKGIYSLGCACVDADCNQCQNLPNSWREMPFMIWGRVKYYEQTKDQEALNKILEDFNTLSTKILQLNRWNCKLMYDIWQNSGISQEIKNKALALCEKGGYEGSQEDSIEDQNIEDLISETIKNIVNKQSINIDKRYDKKILEENFYRNASCTSENAIISNWNELIKDDKIRLGIKKSGLTLFRNALFGYSLKEVPSVYDNSILGVASLDYYKITNQKDYLDFALYLYEKNKTISMDKIFSYDYAYDAFFTRELKNLITKEEYDENYKKIVFNIINNGFDYKGYNAEFKNKGAFHNSYKTYLTKENGLIVGLILDN